MLHPQTRRRQSSLFPCQFDPQNSVLATIIAEAERLVAFDPQILTKIDESRDRVALEKKRLRVKDGAWSNGPVILPGEGGVEESTLDNLVLLQGRRRMPSLLVFIFSMIRAWAGGSKDELTRTLLTESRSLGKLLTRNNWKMPGASTIADNCNMVSQQTQEYILAATLRMARSEALDGYNKVAFDSTAVASQSAFPTDSDIISKLLSRARWGFELLRRFGLETRFSQDLELRIEEVLRLAKEIALTSGKNAKRKRKKRYFEMYRKALASRVFLLRGLGRLEEQLKRLQTKPSTQARIDMIVASINDDLQELERAVEASKARIKEGKKVPATEKVVSVSDADAALIVKGGRQPVLGYKPQLGRSENGLITAFSLLPGNGADALQLVPLVHLHIANTGIAPQSVSFDDGYSSKAGIEQCLKIPGVEHVSVGGAKGKKAIPPELYESQEYRDLRCFRSTVESTIGHIKQCHGFGKCSRAGIEAVRQEMFEKVISFNLRKIANLRQRKDAK